MVDEYFFVKLFFWVIFVCIEVSVEVFIVVWKKIVKKKKLMVKLVYVE